MWRGAVKEASSRPGGAGPDWDAVAPEHVPEKRKPRGLGSESPAGVSASARPSYPPTTITCNRRGPWAPSSRVCSMSPEREGPVMKFTVRGISPLP